MLQELLTLLAEHDARMEQYLDTHALLVVAEAAGVRTRSRQRRAGGRLQTTVLETTGDLVQERARAAKLDAENRRTESPFAARNRAKYRFELVSYGKVSFAPFKPSPQVFVGTASVEGGELTELVMKPAKNDLLVGGYELSLKYENQTPAGRNVSSFQLTSRVASLRMTFTFES